MARQYMDEKILSIKRNLEDEKARAAMQETIDKEIAAQDISSGQVVIYGAIVPFAPRELLDGRLTLTVPEDWTVMSPEVAKIKYPLGSQPPIILTDPTITINITVNHMAVPLKQDPTDIATFVEFMKRVTDKSVKARFFDDGLAQNEETGLFIGWYEYAIFNWDGDNLYNFVCATSLENRALLMSFNCLNEQKPRWKSLAEDILLTLKLTGRDMKPTGDKEEKT